MSTDQDDPANTLLSFLQSPFADQIQANSIWVALGYSFGVTAAVTILFSLIRPRHVVVYAPKLKYADKKHTPPPMGKGILDWIGPIAKIKEDVLIEKIGLDAAIFLRFVRMLRNLFVVLTVLGCAILIPVHITQTNQTIAAGTTNLDVNSTTYILSMTPQAAGANSMWSHVAIGYIFNITVLGFIWWNYRAVADIKKKYFQSSDYQHSLHSRSLWLVDIPPQQRSDEGILKIVDSIEHTTSLPRAAIARNVKELPQLIEEHTATVKQLESVLAKYLRDPSKLPPNRPLCKPSKHDHRARRSEKVDAIEYLTRRTQELEMEIKDVRESIDKRNAMGYGFATYDRIEEAHTVAYAARNKHPAGTTVRLAPKPNDFIWKNLSLSKKSRASKRFGANLWVALLTFIWIAPNAMIAIFLVNLSHLGALWPGFQDSLNGNPKFWGAIQAILGPTLLSTVYLCLPIIFRRLSTRSGDLTKTSREKHVTHKLYAFFIFNNLIVFSIFGAIWGFVSAVVRANQEHGTDIWTAIQQANLARTLMTSLCTVSIFWVTWLLQRNLGAAVDIAQLLQLTIVWFARTFMSPTPRQNIEWTAPQPFDYASYYNYFLFYTTVALCNATLQPIVLPCALIIFAIEAVLKKYLLLYVYITKTESGGQFWNILVNRILFGLGVAHIVEALVIKGAQGSVPWTTYSQLIALIPLFFMIGGFKWYCVKTFEPRCKYYIKALPSAGEFGTDGVGSSKKRKNERIGVKFGHPALYKPLIAPMVHAKAQHMLSSIYSGRIEGDGGATTHASGYSDIAMGPMSQTEPGTKAGGATDMFEVVPEANMDFAYYKQRADFSDEYGGGGELYGRAADLISERSGTPASFLTQDSEDGPYGGDAPPMPQLQHGHPAYRTPVGGSRAASGSRGASPMGMPTGQPTLPNVGPPGGEGPYYNHKRSGSDRSLLLNRAAQPAGYAPISRQASDFHGSGEPSPYQAPENYGMDRWRPAASGYVGVSSNEEDMSYDSYRQHARGGGGGSIPSTPGGYQPYGFSQGYRGQGDGHGQGQGQGYGGNRY